MARRTPQKELETAISGERNRCLRILLDRAEFENVASSMARNAGNKTLAMERSMVASALRAAMSPIRDNITCPNDSLNNLISHLIESISSLNQENDRLYRSLSELEEEKGGDTSRGTGGRK